MKWDIEMLKKETKMGFMALTKERLLYDLEQFEKTVPLEWSEREPIKVDPPLFIGIIHYRLKEGV